MNDWVLLIDFGTSFSRASIADADGRVRPLPVDGRWAVPSGVWADPSGQLRTGRDARRQALLAPERWDRAPKRSLGQAGPMFDAPRVPVVDAVAQVLRSLSEQAIAAEGGAPREVRLTCPARWDNERQRALLKAARQAGLDAPPSDGVHLVQTPIAAANYLAEHGRLPAGARIALFDLGAGDLETTVIESTTLLNLDPDVSADPARADSEAAPVDAPVGPRFLIRSLGGITGLGGEMFDDILDQEMLATVLSGWSPKLAARLMEPPDGQWRRAAEGLHRQVRRAREELSTAGTVPLATDELIDFPLELHRTQIENLLRPQLLRAAGELAATIERAGLCPQELDAVYLAGGVSRMPLVAQVVLDTLGVVPELLEETSFLAGTARAPTISRLNARADGLVPMPPPRPVIKRWAPTPSSPASTRA